VTGASLKKRIDQILNCQPIRRLGVLRKVVLVVCLGAPIALPVMAGVGWHTYTTAVGGLKRIVLDDQIDIVMNTSTTLRARRTGARRDFVLAAGEALFEAPHTLWHPLYVTAESALLVSSGASFSVRIHEPDTVEVLVKEGSVDLRAIRESSPAGSQRSTARLSAGDAATIVHGVATVQRLPAEEIIRTLAWTSGRLWFDRVTLDEAVAEFNRYNRQQLEIDDPRIAALRMGGAFDATDLYSFTAALETFGITAKRDPGAEVEPGGGTFHLSRAPAGR
jgi:transmembrane sensor